MCLKISINQYYRLEGFELTIYLYIDKDIQYKFTVLYLKLFAGLSIQRY